MVSRVNCKKLIFNDTNFYIQVKMLFPEDGLVYDYQLQDGGVSNSNNDGDDDDEEGKNVEVNSCR